MKDYKELIKNINGDAAFRHIISECGADGRVWFDKRFICDYVSRLKHVVEQLVKKLGEARNELGEALVDVRHAEEYAWEVKQERDALAKSLDQTLVRLNDETVRAERLEAENRAKEQYIAETIGKLARERKRDDEIIASLQKELVEAAKERDAAIAFVPRVCKTCKRDGLQYLAGGKLDSLCDTCRRNRRCNWEWRGVQEVEHEAD